MLFFHDFADFWIRRATAFFAVLAGRISFFGRGNARAGESAQTGNLFSSEFAHKLKKPGCVPALSTTSDAPLTAGVPQGRVLGGFQFRHLFRQNPQRSVKFNVLVNSLHLARGNAAHMPIIFDFVAAIATLNNVFLDAIEC